MKSEFLDDANAENRAGVREMEDMEADKSADQVSIAQVIS
jgi:hypothetical protein